LGVSLESYVADNDMLGHILRSVRGVEVNDDTLGIDSIREVCAGEGHYLGHSDTLERMKSDYYYPAIGDRQSPDEWQADGSLDIQTRARNWARDALVKKPSDYISEDIDQRLRERFNLLLAQSEVRS